MPLYILSANLFKKFRAVPKRMMHHFKMIELAKKAYAVKLLIMSH